MSRRIALTGGLLLLVITSLTSGRVQVQETWVARYDGPASKGDHASAIAVDEAGNVYVTGGSAGQLTGPFDYATAKYDADGHQLWVARYNGPGNAWDFARAVAVDAAGNVYVTGESTGAGTFFDYATIKYDAQGNELWVARYNGPANGGDAARALAVDATGNVYVTGESAGIGTGPFDYATVKYDAYGRELWVARFTTPGDSFDSAVAVGVDAAGHVFVTGRTGGDDYGTIKYDADGTELWVAFYNGPGNSTDIARALAVDAAGHVHVTGDSVGVDTDFDYATIAYDEQGNESWVARYNGPGNAADSPRALAIDTAGNVHVTGGSMGVDSGLDYATVKYDPFGNELWVARYNGPGNASDFAAAVTVDAAGNVYVTGQSFGAGTDFDYATVKYVQTNPPDEQFMLTLTKEGTGRGTVTSSPSGVACGHDCDQPYATGTTVKLRARPASGSIFVGWDGCDSVSHKTCTVTMNSDRTVTAEFSRIRFVFPVQ